MTPEQIQFLVLEYMSKIPKASKEHIPINEPLRKWDGTKEELVDILKDMQGKSVLISALYRFAKPESSLDNHTIRAQLSKKWHSYYIQIKPFDYNRLEYLPEKKPRKKMERIRRIRPLHKLKLGAGVIWKIIIGLSILVTLLVGIIQLLRWRNGL